MAVYDIDALLNGIADSERNIQEMQNCIDAERAKIEQYREHIKESQEILDAHKKGLAVEEQGD